MSQAALKIHRGAYQRQPRMSFAGKNRHGKTPFTPDLWVKWHEARVPGKDTFHLKAGIQEMRALLARRDRLNGCGREWKI